VCVFDACNTEISCTCGRVLFSSYVSVSVCVYECVYECVCVCVCMYCLCVCVYACLREHACVGEREEVRNHICASQFGRSVTL